MFRLVLVSFHIVSLLVFFVSHGFASVSHPKFLFRFEAKQAKLGGQFRYFASKSFASFRFSFTSKQNFEIRGHPSDRLGFYSEIQNIFGTVCTIAHLY